MPITTRAAVLIEPGAEFTFADIELGELAPTEILVRIVATGLCHSDLAVQHGDIPSPFPLVVGHEGAGIVEQTGQDVVDFVVGDRVALSYDACRHCVNCLSGREAYCLKFGLLNVGGAREDGTSTMTLADGGALHGSFFGQSSFAGYAIASERNAVKIPDDVSLEIVGPLGCGFQTGAGTVLNTLDVHAGASVVVTGTGAVGLAAVMAAKAAGATTIIAVDVIDERLTRASEFGATHTINGTQDDATARILEITGIGADYAIDTTAVPAVITQILMATRPDAAIALLGVGKPDASIPLGLIATKRIIGATEGDSVPQVFLPRLLALHRAGLFPFDKLITTYPFDDLTTGDCCTNR